MKPRARPTPTTIERFERRDGTVGERIRGGCPCGFWSVRNCRYLQASRICEAPFKDRP